MPGTYLSIDMYGNVGFGFSEVLWSQTQNFLDEEINKLRPQQQAGNLQLNENPNFMVVVQDFGTGSITSGLVPDKLALDAEKAWILQQMSPGDQKYLRGLELTNSPWAGTAFSQLLIDFYPNLAPYAIQLADGYGVYYEQFLATFGIKAPR